jgi:hypothetical protein
LTLIDADPERHRIQSAEFHSKIRSAKFSGEAYIKVEMASMHSFALPVQMPFDWESLLAFMRRRATPGVETVTERVYTRTITDGTTPQTLSVTYDAAGACLRIAYSGDAGIRSVVERRVKQIFKPDVSTRPIETQFQNGNPSAPTEIFPHCLRRTEDYNSWCSRKDTVYAKNIACRSSFGSGGCCCRYP